MSLKNSLANFGRRIKTAAENHIDVYKKRTKVAETYSRVCVLDDVDNMPVGDVDTNLGKSCCKITYCIEDWMGFLSEDYPGTIAHTCPLFNGNKCTKECNIKSANNELFDAQIAYEQARKNYKNSVKQIFGNRVKA